MSRRPSPDEAWRRRTEPKYGRAPRPPADPPRPKTARRDKPFSRPVTVPTIRISISPSPAIEVGGDRYDLHPDEHGFCETVFSWEGSSYRFSWYIKKQPEAAGRSWPALTYEPTAVVDIRGPDGAPTGGPGVVG